MSEIVQVKVAGRSYRVRSDEGSADLRAVARLVNNRIAKIRRAAPDLEKEQLAILAALNMGDELLCQRATRDAEADEVEQAVQVVRGRLSDLAERMEQAALPQD